jgi:hypothetical protein
MKIHVIEADTAGYVQSRDALGKKIGALAKLVNEPVFFHDYAEPVCGAPVILLECSDAFLEKVKQFPECKKVEDISSSEATQRSPQIQSYFTGSKPRNFGGPRF